MIFCLGETESSLGILISSLIGPPLTGDVAVHRSSSFAGLRQRHQHPEAKGEHVTFVLCQLNPCADTISYEYRIYFIYKENSELGLRSNNTLHGGISTQESLKEKEARREES